MLTYASPMVTYSSPMRACVNLCHHMGTHGSPMRACVNLCQSHGNIWQSHERLVLTYVSIWELMAVPSELVLTYVSHMGTSCVHTSGCNTLFTLHFYAASRFYITFFALCLSDMTCFCYVSRVKAYIS